MADNEDSIVERGTKRSLSDNSETDQNSDNRQKCLPTNDVSEGNHSKRLRASGDTETTGSIANDEKDSAKVVDVEDGDGDTATDKQCHRGSPTNDGPNSNGDDFDNATTPSSISEGDDAGIMHDLTDLLPSSDTDEETKGGWRPTVGPISWVQRQMIAGENPRDVLHKLVSVDADLPDDLDELTLWKIIIGLVTEPPRRDKLQHVNTLHDVIHLLKTCSKIMVLTGAGVSVSCGIPDFRSRDGIYARLSVEYPDLPDPQAMFDIRYFRHNPQPFFKFAKEIYPGQFQPSTSHKFIRLLEEHGKLLRNYTQNIDTLEQVAGIEKIIQCHGSFATATCMVCKNKVDLEVVRENIMNQVLPHCSKCSPTDELAIMKPDIVFFGESLPDEFHHQMDEDKQECDLLIVIGSSLKVRPVALIPHSLPAEVPQILINREPLRHMDFDVELLGDCDVIINELCQGLGTDWTRICTRPALQQRMVSSPSLISSEGDVVCEERSQEPSLTMATKPDASKSDDIVPDRAMKADAEASCSATREDKKKDCDSGVLTHEKDTKTLETDAKTPESDKETPETDTKTSETDIETAETATKTSETDAKTPETDTKTPETDAKTPKTDTKTPETDTKTAATDTKTPETDTKLLLTTQEEMLDTFVFLPPSRYLFQGAENYQRKRKDSLDSSSSSSSSGSSVSGISSDSSTSSGEKMERAKKDKSPEAKRKESTSNGTEPSCSGGQGVVDSRGSFEQASCSRNSLASDDDCALQDLSRAAVSSTSGVSVKQSPEKIAVDPKITTDNSREKTPSAVAETHPAKVLEPEQTTESSTN